MINLRRISQLVFLALFIYLLLITVEPVGGDPATYGGIRGLLPQKLFFVSDPLLTIATVLASRSFLMIFLSSLVVLVSAVLLGRVFCGWACPLGTSIDLVNRLKRNKPFSPSYHPALCSAKSGTPLSLRKPKYLILLLIIVTAILGVNIAGWFDPITIVFKSFGLVLYPVGDFLIKGVIDGVGLKDLSKPLGSINLLDRNPVLYHGAVIFFLLFAAILIATLYQTRFWCRTICPLGGLLGLLGKWRLLRVDINSKCTDCGKCSLVCKTGAISENLRLYDEECIQCYSCVAGCPADAITLNFKRTSMIKLPALPERRGLLIGQYGQITGITGTAWASYRGRTECFISAVA
ncbi:MAG: 4Fe-4S binding protein [Planctomycetes bacterium]|nr:4Fe-4S binding protein [Planctomycetota bacterium]